MAIVASAPTRLDFGGGWTDVPPFPEERGGFVCNLAIERRATVHVADGAAWHGGEPPAPDPLIDAALRFEARAGVTTAERPAAHIMLTSDFPVSAGLGGSSAAGVALAAALAARRGAAFSDRSALAEWSRAVEVEELGIAGGRQDHYAAAYGGALGLTFGRDVIARQIPLTDATITALERAVLVVYTGESRISGETISAVLDAYRARVPAVVHALDRMAELARDMAAALEAGDLSHLAALVDEHWVNQRALHPRITTPRIDALAHAVRQAGATGLKALGASGGGCVVVFAPAGDEAPVRDAAARYGQLLPWSVARRGVIVES
ncbi:MAG: hypothetical protein RLZZ621_2110 [Gemmatimonadota bacterium]